jgi:hypothetical protein
MPLIPFDSFQSYFNLEQVNVPLEHYERASALAEQRLVNILKIKIPDFTLPSSAEELTGVQYELLLHLTLIELIKTFNYIYEENKGRASLKLITSQVDRLATMAIEEANET